MSLNIAHLAMLHVIVTAALAGLIWTVQLAIYPQFGAIGRDDFAAYHRRYVRGITGLVAVLMGLEVVTAALLFGQGVRGAWFVGSLVPIAMIWAITFAVELPLQRRLGQGYDAEAHRQLVWTNWARTLAWTARTAMVSKWLFSLSAW
jgi:hypothetical protein